MFEAGKKPREQLRMPQEAYVQVDQWMDYLGYEQYCWWRKFISWVDRSPSRTYEFHVPYTLESVYQEHLKVSKSHFYKKIKAIWECGLIDLVEFDKTNRKTTKPRNIIVYDYPFNNAEFEYKPLEKKRDWVTEYESESKVHGYKGALISRIDKGLQMETVEKEPVDNSEIEGLQMETVEGLQMETVRVSNQRPINYLNNLLINNNNSINDLNNSLSNMKIDLIQEILTEFNFSEGERVKIIELINERQLFNITKHDIINQASSMTNRPEIRMRALYFVNGLEANLGRITGRIAKTSEGIKDFEIKTKQKSSVPFYNWLEE